MTTTYAVSVGVVDIRRDPDATSELVTQALMNMPALIGETYDEWTHITLSDYTGWIRSSQLAPPALNGSGKHDEQGATVTGPVAVVTVTHTPLYTDMTGDETSDTIYLSTALPVLDATTLERLQVVLPGGSTAWIARTAVDIRSQDALYPQVPISIVITYSRTFENVPYLWGGTSWEGIDCSGFVQLCHRMGGNIIPRDADQQHDALAHSIKREDMQEGDLIFFGTKAITHVALALNNKEYIHAEGQNYNHVVVNSFDPDAPHYYKRLDEIVWGIKRVVS